jgi:hypothetical protein
MHMPKPHDIIDEVYATTGVRVQNCRKRCGDAHCCGSPRRAARCRMLAATPTRHVAIAHQGLHRGEPA